MKACEESELELVRHCGGFLYEVRLHKTVYKFIQTPHSNEVESFVYGLRAVYAASLCPYTDTISRIVKSEDGRYIRGYLMPLLAPEGISLADVLGRKENRALTWSTRKEWARQLLTAVAALHRNGFIHGNITLSRIFLVPRQPPRAAFYIIDVPPASQIRLPPPSLMSNCAISPYLAPELRDIAGTYPIRPHLNAMSDIHAVGAVLWALASNDPNLEGKCTLNVVDLPKHAIREVGLGYMQILLGCLVPDPAVRGTAEELCRMLEQDTHVSPDAHPSVPPAPVTQQPVSTDVDHNPTNLIQEQSIYNAQVEGADAAGTQEVLTGHVPVVPEDDILPVNLVWLAHANSIDYTSSGAPLRTDAGAVEVQSSRDITADAVRVEPVVGERSGRQVLELGDAVNTAQCCPRDTTASLSSVHMQRSTGYRSHSSRERASRAGD